MTPRTAAVVVRPTACASHENDDDAASRNPRERAMSSLPPEKQAELRAWLVAFYQRHNPEKIDGVDTILTKFQGKEHELVYQLERKYAVAPGGPDAAPSLPPPAPPTEPSAPQPPPVVPAPTSSAPASSAPSAPAPAPAPASAPSAPAASAAAVAGADFAKVQQRAAELDEERARITAERDKLVASLRMLQGRYETQRNTAQALHTSMKHELDEKTQQCEALQQKLMATMDREMAHEKGAKDLAAQLNARGAQVQSLEAELAASQSQCAMQREQVRAALDTQDELAAQLDALLAAFAKHCDLNPYAAADAAAAAGEATAGGATPGAAASSGAPAAGEGSPGDPAGRQDAALRTALRAARIEVAASMRGREEADARVREQAVHAHVLEERAKALGEQLAAESGSAQTLRTMMESAQHELKTTSASCDALRAERDAERHAHQATQEQLAHLHGIVEVRAHASVGRARARGSLRVLFLGRRRTRRGSSSSISSNASAAKSSPRRPSASLRLPTRRRWNVRTCSREISSSFPSTNAPPRRNCRARTRRSHASAERLSKRSKNNKRRRCRPSRSGSSCGQQQHA